MVAIISCTRFARHGKPGCGADCKMVDGRVPMTDVSGLEATNALYKVMRGMLD